MTIPQPVAHTFAEPDYMYGAGPLALCIDQVDHAHPVRYEGETWLQVEGMQLNTGGAAIGRRSALVRARRLPSALQHPAGRPNASRPGVG